MMDKSRSDELFRQAIARCEMGLAAAIEQSDHHLAALNCRQGVKHYLKQGLIQWRNSDSPTATFKNGVAFHSRALQAMLDIEPRAGLSITSVERVSFISFLLDMDCVAIDTQEFTDDRLLDAVLCNALRGDCDDREWERGLEIVRSQGSLLALETYQAYIHLLTRPLDHRTHFTIAELEMFYRRRRKDGYFSGGDQTEGGGPDNDRVVDYRLAAIMKKLTVTPDSIHTWRW